MKKARDNAPGLGREDDLIELLRGGLIHLGVPRGEIWHEVLHDSPRLFERCIDIAFSDEHPTAWRACYLVDCTTEKYPDLIVPYIEKLCQRLPTLDNSSQKRHFARILTRIKIPENWLGIVVNTCFKWLYSNEPVAVKVHCMQVIFQAGKTEPDLLLELKAIIEEQWDTSSKGFRSRGRKLLAAIEAQRKMKGNS